MNHTTADSIHSFPIPTNEATEASKNISRAHLHIQNILQIWTNEPTIQFFFFFYCFRDVDRIRLLCASLKCCMFECVCSVIYKINFPSDFPSGRVCVRHLQPPFNDDALHLNRISRVCGRLPRLFMYHGSMLCCAILCNFPSVDESNFVTIYGVSVVGICI